VLVWRGLEIWGYENEVFSCQKLGLCDSHADFDLRVRPGQEQRTWYLELALPLQEVGVRIDEFLSLQIENLLVFWSCSNLSVQFLLSHVLSIHFQGLYKRFVDGV
jgi:hypothetical protein